MIPVTPKIVEKKGRRMVAVLRIDVEVEFLDDEDLEQAAQAIDASPVHLDHALGIEVLNVRAYVNEDQPNLLDAK